MEEVRMEEHINQKLRRDRRQRQEALKTAHEPV